MSVFQATEPPTRCPNPRRVAAGKANRKKAGPLSDDGRRLLREAAKLNQPWRFATGPKTEKGKRQSSVNARRVADPTSEIATRIASYARVLRKFSRTRYVNLATCSVQTTEMLRDLVVEAFTRANQSSTVRLTKGLRERARS